MKSTRRTMTDQEYIEFIRTWMKKLKWLGLVSLCVASLCFFWSVVVLRIHFAHLTALSRQEAFGFIIGIGWGLLGGLIVCALVESLMRAGRYMTGHRTERLVLRFGALTREVQQRMTFASRLVLLEFDTSGDAVPRPLGFNALGQRQDKRTRRRCIDTTAPLPLGRGGARVASQQRPILHRGAASVSPKEVGGKDYSGGGA